MALTKAQLASLDKLMLKEPLIKADSPALKEAVDVVIRNSLPGLKKWQEEQQMLGGFGTRASMGEVVVGAVVTGVVGGIFVVVCADVSRLGSEVEQMSEANIRAIAKKSIARFGAAK